MDFNKNVKPQTDWQGRVTGYKAERIFPDPASASRGQDYLDGINPAGFVPFGDKGEPFDPPETKPIYYCYPVSIKDAHPQDCEGSDPWPSDKDATDYTTGPVSGGVTQKTHYNGIPIRLPNGKLNPLAISAVIRKVKADQPPPNCDGFGHEPAHVGQAMAHAQHEAAIDGDGCTAGACLLTRGAND